MATLTREFTFDAAHQLVDYDGKCACIHGHTYRLLVTVEGHKLQQIGPKKGMIIDFGQLKKVVNEEVIEKLDHKFLAEGNEAILQLMDYVYSQFHHDMNPSTIFGENGLQTLGFRTTAENLAKWIYFQLDGKLSVKLREVKLYETPNSCVTYNWNDYARDVTTNA